jgi:hypothetical protein
MRCLIVFALALAACTGGATDASTPTTTSRSESTTTRSETSALSDYSPAETAPEGPLDAEAAASVDSLLDGVFTTGWDVSAVEDLVEGQDPRTAWLIADLLRFYQSGAEMETLSRAFSELTGVEPAPDEVEFVWATNHLISRDMPAWDGYPAVKRQIFGPVVPTWDAFFAEDHGIDWRLVTWGGVAPDTRPLDDNGPCNCISALDHPETTNAAGGGWYDDSGVVFGVMIGEDAIALPKHQMEVHEMVNLTLGGRELGIPYCTLCGSAQGYLADNVPGVERIVLRTSGLLSRSNKLMYDLTTGSAIDTFTGRALSGPLGADGVVLDQVSVAASTWGDWKAAHPDTRILAKDGGIGRAYTDDPLGGRDDAGPIFPVGDIDPRLTAQERVVEVIAADGTPVAFPVMTIRAALADGPIEFEGLTVRLDDSIRVYDSVGNELVSHEAFWFAWSQFHEGTHLWTPDE